MIIIIDLVYSNIYIYIIFDHCLKYTNYMLRPHPVSNCYLRIVLQARPPTSSKCGFPVFPLRNDKKENKHVMTYIKI
jgi:hypothetical protein